MDNAPFIGQLDRKISIVELVKTPNSTGEMETTETVVLSLFSQMIDLSGTEDVEGKIRHIINRAYVVRHNPTVLAKAVELKVVDGSQKFSVYHAYPIGRKRFIKLMVRDYE